MLVPTKEGTALCCGIGSLVGCYYYRNHDHKERIYQIGRYMFLGASIYTIPLVMFGTYESKKNIIGLGMIGGSYLGSLQPTNRYHEKISNMLWGGIGGGLINIAIHEDPPLGWFSFLLIAGPPLFTNVIGNWTNNICKYTQKSLRNYISGCKPPVAINCNVTLNVKPHVLQCIKNSESFKYNSDEDVDDVTNEVVNEVTKGITNNIKNNKDLDDNWDVIDNS
jgi:hypothetical protein